MVGARMKQGVVCRAAFLLCCSFAGSYGPSLLAATKADVADRLQSLGLASIDAKVTDAHTPDLAEIERTFGRGELTHVYSGVLLARKSFSRDGTLARYTDQTEHDGRMHPTLDGVPRIVGYDLIIGGDRSEALFTYKPVTFTGVIDKSLGFPPDWSIDHCLGMRCLGSGKWISPLDVDQLGEEVLPDGKLSLQLRNADGTLHRWTYSGDAPVVLERYEVVRKDGRLTAVATASGQIESGGVVFPKAVTISCYTYPKGQPYELRKLTFEFTAASVGIKRKENAFSMLWPKGSEVHDRRDDKTYQVESGDRQLTDDDLLALARPIAEPTSGPASIPVASPAAGSQAAPGRTE